MLFGGLLAYCCKGRQLQPTGKPTLLRHARTSTHSSVHRVQQ